MIRLAAPTDYTKLFEINETCHKIAVEPRISLLEKIKTWNTWVYELDGQVVGFLIGRQEGRLAPANIYNVAVLPEFRKQGIASSLIEEFEKFYAGQCVYYYLHVDAQNPAQKLYFDHGYRVFELKADFYGPNTLALRMMKLSRR